MWRIFSFDIHYRIPAVKRLPFHLPGDQNVVFNDDSVLEDVLDNPSANTSMFLEWMETNKTDSFARTLTYVEFPTYYVWKADDKKWSRRSQCEVIGRIHQVSPTQGELFYLRILLNIVKGPTSFEDIRTVKGIVYCTYKDACYELGLLDDDKEYIQCIHEASLSGSGPFLRNLFCMLLFTETLTKPEVVWEKTWTYLSEDIMARERNKSQSTDIDISVERVQNFVLSDIEDILKRNGTTLKNFPNMPYPVRTSNMHVRNKLIDDETSYNTNSLRAEHEDLFRLLTSEQQHVYEKIMDAVISENGGVFFLYGYGGTGKTFVWKTLSAAIRSKGEIVLNVASSGIAALLLDGGRTAHSRFAIPIVLNEDSFCYIRPDSDLAYLIRKTKLIIWDEAPMIHKHAYEALDRTLRDVLRSEDNDNMNKPFGGKVIVFGGDFRQVLPVIQNGSRQDVVNASLNSSYLWKHCQVLKLTVNMRLCVGSNPSDVDDIKEFSDWILKIGDGKIGASNNGESIIEIPEDILVKETEDPIRSIIDAVYPDVVHNLATPNYFQEKAILAPTNEYVNTINDRIMKTIPGEEKVYLSSDTICQSETGDNFDKDMYSPDFLNGLCLSGIPNHKLTLKPGIPVMLLRNIDQSAGLCNGTRLQIVRLGDRVIEAKIISGSSIGEKTFIPRMRLSSSDRRVPFKFYRRQFPLVVSFAMTINKSQGQSLSNVGLYLQKPVFTHGQLYVALSRAKSKKGLKVLIKDKDGNVTNCTTNVVYKEVLQKL